MSLYGAVVWRAGDAGPSHADVRSPGIAAAIRNSSGSALSIEFGSLYPALKRLELKGWIVSKWETSEHNRRAKVYRLTPAGRRRLRDEQSEWAKFVKAVALIMKPAAGEAE
jgi:PadR family transcriptional regulator, regulatory protein PadR